MTTLQMIANKLHFFLDISLAGKITLSHLMGCLCKTVNSNYTVDFRSSIDIGKRSKEDY